MYVSESTFVHLRQAEDERQSQELEYRRIAYERSAGRTSASGHGLRALAGRIGHWGHPAPKPLSHA